MKFISFLDIAKINDDIQIHHNNSTFSIVEKGKTVAIIPDSVEIGDSEGQTSSPVKGSTAEQIKDLQGVSLLSDIKPIHFSPPAFGVTVLGNSHGFDPKGCTSGYVIWVNGR